MTDEKTDPHARYFAAAEASFTDIRDTAKWQDPPIATLLTQIRRRVLAGGFPVNMEVEPLQYDAVAESVHVPRQELHRLRGESEAMRSVRQQIQKVVRAMDRERRQQRIEVGAN